MDGPVLDCHPVAFEASVVPLRVARVERLLGVAFEPAYVKELLTPLGFEIVGEHDGVLDVRVPGFRSYDVTREVDLIEEVARAHGFDAFPDQLGPYRPGTVPDDPMFGLEDELRDLLVGRGLFESQTPAFAPPGEGDVEVANPLATTEPFMRRAVLPALLRRVEHNLARGNRDVRLFEIGTSFRRAGSGSAPREATHLAAVLTGRRAPPHWAHADEPYTIWDLKSVFAEVAACAHRGGAPVVPAGESVGGADSGQSFDPDQSFAAIDSAGAVLGLGGRVADGVVDAPVWAGEVWAFEIALPADVVERPVPRYRALPHLPAAERDLALIVPDGVSAHVVATAIRDAAGDDLEALDLFDLYTGAGVPEGARSLAYRLRFRSPTRTLKDAEVDKAVNTVLRRLEEGLGVQARG